MRGHSLFCISLLTVLLLAGEPPAKGYTDGQAVRFDLYRDYLIVAKGSAGPVKGLHFLVDTGASPTVLDRPLAQKLHLEEMPASIAVVEGSVQAGRATLPSLQFGPLRRDNLNVLIEDLSFFKKPSPSTSTPWWVWTCSARAPSKSTTLRVKFVSARFPL